MQIFKNRPLFCACMLCMLFSVILFFTDYRVKIAIAAFCVLIFPVVIWFKCSKHLSLHGFITVILCIAFMFLSCVSSFVYFDLLYEKYSSLDEDSEHNVEAVVLSNTYAAGASSEYTLLVTKFDSKNIFIKANLECEYISSLTVGNKIKGKLVTGTFDDSIGSYSEQDMMLSEGVFIDLVSTSEDDYSVIHEQDSYPMIWLYKANDTLTRKLIHGIGKSEGGLAAAIFLGNKDAVRRNITRDSTRSGASHILAISGLHMGIIFGFLALLLQYMFVPAKGRAVILSLVAVFYLAFTGFSVSATRSIIMLLIVYLSTLLSQSADSLTSLSVAGAGILLVSPQTVMSAGFWMSFGATLGIIICMPPLQTFIFEHLQPYYSKWKFIIKPLTYLLTLIVTSLCAIAPLIIVFTVFSKEMSLFSVISSIVLGIPTSAVLILTPLYLLLARVPFLGNIVKMLLKFVCKFMIDFCASISERSDCMISFNYKFVLPAGIALFFVLFLCLFLKFKYKWIAPAVFSAALAVFFVAVAISAHQNSKYINISYVNRESNRNIIIATNGDQTVLFDMTPGYYSTLRCAFDEMSNMNVTEIDSYVLTGYTTAHISSLSKSFKSQRIRKLYIPTPENQDEYFRMMSIMECATDNGVIVDFYELDKEQFFIQGLSVTIKKDRLERSTAPVIMLQMTVGDNKLTYLSPSYIESSLADDAFDTMESTDYLIFGSRGPSPKQKYKIQNGTNLKEIIFSSKEVAACFDTSSYVYYGDTSLILCPEIYRYKFLKPNRKGE